MPLVSLVFMLYLTAAAAAQTLYNGIVLPAGFPSNDATYNNAEYNAVNSHQPQPLPAWMQTRPAVIPINIGRQVFIPVTSSTPGPNNPDSTNREFLVDSTSNLTRTYHYGSYHDAYHGLLDPNTNACLTFSDGVWYDPNVGKYILYTHLQDNSDGSLYAIGKYYSDDGINWTKVNNNVAMTIACSAFGVTNAAISGCDSTAIWLDQDETNPAKHGRASSCGSWRTLASWPVAATATASAIPARMPTAWPSIWAPSATRTARRFS